MNDFQKLVGKNPQIAIAIVSAISAAVPSSILAYRRGYKDGMKKVSATIIEVMPQDQLADLLNKLEDATPTEN